MIIRISTSTYPTELKLAIITGHVIASFTFFYVSFAHWTELNFFSSNPFFKLLVNLFFARTKSSMKFSTTFEANLLSTFTYKFLSASAFSSHKLFATYFRAPSHHRILIQKLYLLKLEILYIQIIIFFFLSTGQNLLNILFRELFFTLMIATLKFENLGIQYQLFNVLSSAKFALCMRA